MLEEISVGEGVENVSRLIDRRNSMFVRKPDRNQRGEADHDNGQRHFSQSTARRTLRHIFRVGIHPLIDQIRHGQRQTCGSCDAKILRQCVNSSASVKAT